MVYKNLFLENESGIPVPDGFLPFGPVHGDSIGPRSDDESSEEIRLDTDVIIFGSNHNRLYVSHRFQGVSVYVVDSFSYPSSYVE